MRRGSTIVAVLMVMVVVAGCGGDDEEPGGPNGVPAAGENTPPSGTPGVPAGALYDVNGFEWRELSQSDKLEAATDFVRDTSARCDGADVEAVAAYVTNSYGSDFPPDIPAADVLLEGCDADA